MRLLAESVVDRLAQVLSEAGLRGELSWSEIDRVLLILDRFDHLADAMYWATYLALAPERRPAA